MAATTGPIPFAASTMAAPGMDGFAVTPSDSTNFNICARSLYVGGAGNVTLITPSGNKLEFIAVPAGSILPVMAIRVNNTSTTATSIIAII